MSAHWRVSIRGEARVVEGSAMEGGPADEALAAEWVPRVSGVNTSRETHIEKARGTP